MSIKDRYEYSPNDKLGEGGFASVYLAFDKILQRKVALKFYTNKGEHDKSLVNEIRIAINLEHPNLCRYYDVQIEQFQNIHGSFDQLEIGILEYINGGEIDDYLKINPQSLNLLLKGVLQGLQFLHSKQIIHRDLKPSNILIKTSTEEPVPKIVDFGISKSIDSQKSNSSKLMGTVRYMAPEQFDPKTYGINQKISTNVDLWAFGLILYELVQKEPLIVLKDDLTFSEIATTIQKEIKFHKLEQLPSPYREIAKRCIIPNANNRVKNAAELLSLLQGNTTATTNKDQIMADPIQQNFSKFSVKGGYFEGLAWAKFPNGLVGFVDVNDNKIIEPKYTMAYNFAFGKADVLYQGKLITIDKAGKPIDGDNLPKDKNIISGSSKTQIIESLSQQNSIKFSAKGDYFEGLAWAKFPNELIGFVDRNDNKIIEPKYSMAYNFVDGKAKVLFKDKIITIDRTGKEIINDVTEVPQIIKSPKIEASFIQKNFGAVIFGALILASFLWLVLYQKPFESVKSDLTSSDSITNSGLESTDAYDVTDSATPAAAPESFVDENTIDLNGIKLTGYKGGMEDSMISFLKSGSYRSAANDAALRSDWYAFDHLNFANGSSSELESDSQRQLDNLVAILKVFPESKIRVGGYTDKSGNEASNIKLSQARAEFIRAALIKDGVGAQVIGAEGFGSKFATVDATASNDERAVDRKMAVRFAK